MTATGAITGAGFAISSIATAATASPSVPAAASTPGAASAEQAELQRQSLLLQTRIGRLNQQIAAERRRGIGRVSAPAVSPAPVAAAAAPVFTGPVAAPYTPAAAPVPTWSAAPYTAAPVPVAVASPQPVATTPPPVHTTTGASGTTATGSEPSDGGSDD